jgi:cytochrome subunit of sulfide dehydrogenase
MRILRMLLLTATLGTGVIGIAVAQAADPTLARSLASTCASCHGTDGKSDGILVSLAGQSAESILSKIAQFKDGSRPATIMHQIAKGYTDDQLKLIADYFAAQK